MRVDRGGRLEHPLPGWEKDGSGLNRWPRFTLNKEQEVVDNDACFALSLSLSLSLLPFLPSKPRSVKFCQSTRKRAILTIYTAVVVAKFLRISMVV